MAFTERLRDHLLKEFSAKHKAYPVDELRANGRVMNKLLKEANRVKQVLSANSEHFAQIEGLIDEIDFRLKVTRQELETICADLLARVRNPIDDALRSSQMSMDDIEDVILFGGSSRIPAVQAELKKATKDSELGKSINSDEAAALGGVYQAAASSVGFRVKKFLVREGVIYPVQVEFERHNAADSSTKAPIRRTLFAHMNPFPQKKVMTFSKHLNDFTLRTQYGELSSVPIGERTVDQLISDIESIQIGEYQLKNVADAWQKHLEEVNTNLSEAKGIKAHFRMDESGLLHFDKAEMHFESAVPPEESTLSKLGNKISSFFGSPGEAGGAEKPADETKEKPDKTDKTAKTEKTDEQKDSKTDDKKTVNESAKAVNDSASTNATESKEQAKPTKPTLVRETIEIVAVSSPAVDGDGASTVVPPGAPSQDQMSVSKKKLEDMRANDRLREHKEKARNELESFIFQMNDNLEQDVWMSASTEPERETIREKLRAESNWLEEEATDATEPEEYEKRLKATQKEVRDVQERVYELTERPKALATLRDMLNHSEFFLTSMKNLTGSEMQFFTKVEYETLDKLINNTWKWLNDSEEAQRSVPAHEKPVLVVMDIGQRINDLDREVRYLVGKARSYRPPDKPKPTANPPPDENDKSPDDQPLNEDRSGDSRPTDPNGSSTSQTPPVAPATEAPTAEEEPIPVASPEEQAKTTDGHSKTGQGSTPKETIGKDSTHSRPDEL